MTATKKPAKQPAPNLEPTTPVDQSDAQWQALRDACSVEVMGEDEAD